VSAVFLPGARQIAIGWSNGVSLNTVENGQELWFQETPANVIAFDVQAQGHAFAVALSDGSVMTFDATNGKPTRFQGDEQNAMWGDIAWSPDGRTLAFQFLDSLTRDNPIFMLDVATGHIGAVPDSQTGDGVIPSLVWSPDGSSILIPSLGAPLDAPFPRFVDIQTGQERMHLPQRGQVVSSAPLFLADGQTLASEGPDGTVDLLRFADGVKVKTLWSGSRLLGRRLTEFPDAGSPLFTDPSGRWIAYRGGYEPWASSSQSPLIVWDLARGTVKARLNQAVGDLKERHRLAATFDGDSILMLYESGEITRWAFGDPRARETMLARVPVRPGTWALAWSADGRHLAFSGLYGGVDIYDTSGRLVQRFDPLLTAPALSPDGQLAALFDPNQNTEVIYQVRDRQLLKTLPAAPVLLGAAFSPDGRFLAYGAPGRAVVIELASGKVISLDPAAILPIRVEQALARLIWSPDGQSLITIIQAEPSDEPDQSIALIWKRLQDGSFEAVYHVATVQASNVGWNLVAFSPSGRRVALQTMPQATQLGLIVYDLEAEKVIQTLVEYRLGTWLNDEDLLAIEAQHNTRLTRINVVSGQKTIGVSAYAVAPSPDGKFFAQVEWSSNHVDSSITIRKWQNGEVVALIQGESALVHDHAWSPDGQWLAAVGNNGTLRLWPVKER
jgi:WD40 repeat protein